MTTSKGRLLLLMTCWCVLLLRAGWASAGAGSNSIPLNGMPLNSASQQDGATAAGHSAQRGPRRGDSVYDTACCGQPHPDCLSDPTLASTAAKRKQLTYLVRCALPADVALYADIEGERFTFPGSIGLAPHWLTEAMTPSEERSVSACLLAHVNYSGNIPESPSTRQGIAVPGLEASARSSRPTRFLKGGFSAISLPPRPSPIPVRARVPLLKRRTPILQDRVCTQETGATTAKGMPVTVCQFLVTGPCEEPHSFTVDGLYYPEVIFVYLKPSTR